MRRKPSVFVVCETAAQVRFLADLAAGPEGRTERLTIVAVTPLAFELAREAGLTVRALEDFCAWERLCAAGDHNNALADALCAAADAVLATTVPNHPHRELVSFEAFFHPIKGLLDSLIGRLLPLLGALRSLRPARVACFAAPPYAVAGPELLDKPSAGLTTRLLPLAAQALKFETCILDGGDDPELAAPPPPPPPLRPQGPEISLEQALVELGRSLDDLPPSAPPPGPVLFAEPGLDGFLSGVIETWQTAEWGSVRSPWELLAWNGDLSGVRKAAEVAAIAVGRAVWEGMAASPRVRELLHLEGVDLFSLAEPQLRLLARDHLPLLFVQAAQADRTLAGQRGAVLVLGGMVFKHHVLARAAARHGATVVSCHKGGYLGFSCLPMHERYEFAEADYYACNGSGAARTFQSPPPQAHWRAGRKRGRPVPLGGAWLEDMVRQRTGTRPTLDPADPRPTVVYIMSAFLGDNTYLGYVFQPDFWLQRLQFEMVKFFEGFPDIRFLFKPPLWDRYPQILGSLEKFLDRRRPKNVSILAPNAPLRNILDRYHAFVVDTPSTPLLELAASDRPFLAYLDRRFFKVVHEAAKALTKRAPLARNRKELFCLMETFFRERPWERPMPVDDTFLNLFGTGDPGATRRTAAFLRSLATPAQSRRTTQNILEASPASANNAL
uniref:Uncharacterized protein n=1 Tax=Desulfovibrio sp. U5L TaxID=596152 RepID=I2Q7L9_9BACT